MSRLANKQRKEIVQNLCLQLKNVNLSMNFDVALAGFERIEDYVYTTVADIFGLEEYRQTLFHIHLLSLHLGNKIFDIPIENLLPTNFQLLPTMKVSRSKKFPAIVPCTFTSDELTKTERVAKLPSIEKALKVEKLESMMTCDKCAKPTQVDWIEIQLRGADEPSTIFAHCTKCNNRWRQ